MLSKELERQGIPTAQISAMASVALGVGSPRVVQGMEIVNPLGNANLPPEAERELRREILSKALEALQTGVESPTLFERNKRGK